MYIVSSAAGWPSSVGYLAKPVSIPYFLKTYDQADNSRSGSWKIYVSILSADLGSRVNTGIQNHHDPSYDVRTVLA